MSELRQHSDSTDYLQFEPTRMAGPARLRLQPSVDSSGSQVVSANSAMRWLDAVGAMLLLAVLLPIIVVVSVLVAVTSRGPVIFRQERVGLHGRTFAILKFRTMRAGTQEAVFNDPVVRQAYEANGFKLPPEDARITPIGRLLRKSSVDEIPQLLNVLRGEMSLVGVRPLLEQELALRPDVDQSLYRAQLPGLTGLWQVEGRSTISDHERLALDREYLNTWSVRSNLSILLRTPSAVFGADGAH